MQDFIYCQEDIPREQWRYGFRASADTGCGWIATYNALKVLGQWEAPERLIRDYTRQLPLIHGNLGTLILAPAMYFRKRGYRVDWTSRTEQFDRVLKESDVCILFYRWHKKWKLGAHFVALHHTPEGIIAYNTYKKANGPDRSGESLQTFLQRRKYFGAVLISICKSGGKQL